MIIASLLIIFTLIIPPFFGKSDDGSFYNVLRSNGLYNLDGSELGVFNPQFGVGGEDTGEHFFPITAAKALSGAVFDIRLLALLYLPFYIAGMCLIIASVKSENKYIHLAVCILAALILCDIGYIGYFNSFYTDALYISAFTLLAGSLMFMLSNGKTNAPCLILTVISSAVLAAGGTGVVAAVLAAVIAGRFCFTEKNKIFPAATAVLILALSIFMCGTAPVYTNADADIIKEDTTIKTLDSAAKNAPFLSQEYIPNKSGAEYGMQPEPGLWSYMRRFITPASLLVMAVFFAAVLVIAAMNLKKEPGLADIAVFLAVSSAVFFAVPVLTGGLASVSRRLAMHQLSLDITVIIAVLWICNTLLARRKRLQEKYGVNQ